MIWSCILSNTSARNTYDMRIYLSKVLLLPALRPTPRDLGKSASRVDDFVSKQSAHTSNFR